jgi:hypothetical protein
MVALKQKYLNTTPLEKTRAGDANHPSADNNYLSVHLQAI